MVASPAGESSYITPIKHFDKEISVEVIFTYRCSGLLKIVQRRQEAPDASSPRSINTLHENQTPLLAHILSVRPNANPSTNTSVTISLYPIYT